MHILQVHSIEKQSLSHKVRQSAHQYRVEMKSVFEGCAYMVGERSVSLRRCLVKDAGGIRSANADMSSDNGGEKPPRRKPKVSCSTFIGAG